MKIFGYIIAPYWHPEMIFAIPFAVWFIWRIETIVHLMQVCTVVPK